MIKEETKDGVSLALETKPKFKAFQYGRNLIPKTKIESLKNKDWIQENKEHCKEKMEGESNKQQRTQQKGFFSRVAL